MIDKSGRILVLDDDVDVLARMGRVLRFEGWTDVALCERAEDAFAALDEKPAVAMVVDLLMPGMDGYQVLERMREDYPNVPVIVGTAVDDLDAVVRCMKAGAFDYVPKSAESARLLASIEHAALIASLKEDNRALRQSFLEAAKPPSPSFDRIITRDGRMLSIFRYIEAIVASDRPVLISGESGTGKELVASAIHAASGRSGELVAVNVAGLDDTMFSDTLFGHRRGAFTGADTDRPGLIERAAGGTLFLDEIGDLSAQSQVKLLRLIEQKRYYPLGSDAMKTSDALVVTATHRDLEAAAATGQFRQDLYYRLETHRIRLPPLRERRDDLPLLVERFAEAAAGRFGKKKPIIPPELYDLLRIYDFPGNVRELESMVHDAVARSDSRVLALDSFKARVFRGGKAHVPAKSDADGLFSRLAVLPTLREARAELIREALARSGDNQGVAAGLLGISRSALNRSVRSNEDD